MAYELKNGEEWRAGVLYGWTGEKCEPCKGSGETNDDVQRRCSDCGGTGEAWGVMPGQPKERVPRIEDGVIYLSRDQYAVMSDHIYKNHHVGPAFEVARDALLLTGLAHDQVMGLVGKKPTILIEDGPIGPRMNNVAYLRDLADRLMKIPVVYGTDQADVSRLNELADWIAKNQ